MFCPGAAADVYTTLRALKLKGGETEANRLYAFAEWNKLGGAGIRSSSGSVSGAA